MSQLYAPILLLFLMWPVVVIAVTLTNIVWAICICYRHVSTRAASTGAVLMPLKWIFCPVTAIYLWFSGNIPNSLFALFWPLVIFVIGVVPTVRVGKIQKMFMAELGHESGSPNADIRSSRSSANTGQYVVAAEAPLRPQRSAKVARCIRTIESNLLKRTLSDSEEEQVSGLCGGLLQKALGDEKIVVRLVKLEWTESLDVVDAFRRARDRWDRDHNRFA